MTWAKLDDRANEHRKQLAAGPEACWLWACGLMYANRQPKRDGFIPEQVLPMLYPFPAKQLPQLCAKLVKVGLWVKADGGYEVHQFAAWNKTREQVEGEREATRLRVAEHRRNKRGNGASNGVGNGVTDSVTDEDVPDPYLSAPLPSRPTTNPAGVAAVASVTEPIEDRSRAVPCPPDLWARLVSLGVHEELAEQLKVDVRSVVAELQAFTQTWVVGAYAGQSRPHWARKARQWVINQKKQGLLSAAPADSDDEEQGAPPEIRARAAALREGIGG